MPMSKDEYDVQRYPVSNPRQELISLLRGLFACPVISFLGRRGFVDILTTTGLNLDIDDKRTAELVSLLRYLVALGLLDEVELLRFTATELGHKVFQRFGAFCLIDSYDEYFRDLDWVLPRSNSPRPSVNRERNVIGSGQLHARKFFPIVLSHITNTPYEHLTDLGCGDGTFIHKALTVQPALSITAVDLSEQAINLVHQRLSADHPSTKCSSAICCALDISSWVTAVPVRAEARQIITMWFLLHEIFDGDVRHLADFFRQLRDRFPNASVAFGELFRLSPEQMTASRHESIMPEYVLFHALSGQHLMSEKELSELLSQIPYQLVHRQTLDPVLHGSHSVPSSVVCILAPITTEL
jgi:Methyltransferase domain